MSTDIVPATEAGLIRPVATPSDLIGYHKEVAKLITESLEEGVDYGRVPGTDKPTLLKPGAERLALAFGAHPEYRLVASEIEHDRQVFYTKRKKRWFNGPRGRQFDWEEENGESFGLYRYVYECSLVRADGRVLGTGHGVCSTMESKYVDRPRDCENTALKMAQKRAMVAAVLNAFGLSNRFTQDVEDLDLDDRPANARPSPPTPPPEQPRPAAQSRAPAEAPPQRGPATYQGTDSEQKLLHETLQKRDVEPECWEEIDRELRGKAWTALKDIVPAARKRFADHIARLQGAQPEAMQ